MKLEQMFLHTLDRAMAREIIKELGTTDGFKGIKKPDLELCLKNTLGTSDIYANINWVINTLLEKGYVARKKFTLKNFEEDRKGIRGGPIEIPRYYLTDKGKRAYEKIC